jgi:hypothetical protein
MKYFNQIILCACLGLVIWSCKDDDRIYIPKHLTAVNMRIIVDPDNNQINYQTVETDKFIFDAYSENDDLQEVVFTATYRDQTVVIATFGQSDFADGSVHVELTADDFATAFGVPGFADGSNGGNFAIRPRVKLNDGRVYPDYVYLSATDSLLNVATSIIGSSPAGGAFTLQVLTAITCSPLDISGNYRVISAVGTSTDGCCPGEVTVSGNIVTLTAVNETTFRISDFSGGLYFEWYDVFGISGPDDSPGQFVYNCSEVNFSGTTEPFGTGVSGGGPYDPATGTLTYNWINGFGDQATITLVKQ